MTMQVFVRQYCAMSRAAEGDGGTAKRVVAGGAAGLQVQRGPDRLVFAVGLDAGLGHRVFAESVSLRYPGKHVSLCLHFHEPKTVCGEVSPDLTVMTSVSSSVLDPAKTGTVAHHLCTQSGIRCRVEGLRSVHLSLDSTWRHSKLKFISVFLISPFVPPRLTKCQKSVTDIKA